MEQYPVTHQEMAHGDGLGAVDMRPESSYGPYASPQVPVHFADGPPLSVPTRLLDKSRKLSSGHSHKMGLNMGLRLAHIPSGAGHVLVHYLFTGGYQCLKPKGLSSNEKDAAEFGTGVRVYAAARDYDLPDLEALARCEIEKLGKRLQVMQILDVLRDTLPNPSVDDLWLQGYLKSLIQPFFENPLTALGDPSDSPGRSISFINVLLKVVIELCKTYSLSASLGALGENQGHDDEPAPAHVEIVPEIDAEHNPTTVSTSTLEEEDSSTKPLEGKKKSKRDIKKDKKKQRRAELSNDTATETQNYPNVDEERLEEDIGNRRASTALVADNIIPTSEAGAFNAQFKQQSHTAGNDEGPKLPMFQTPFSFGSSFGSAALNLPSTLRSEALNIPSTIGAQPHFDVYTRGALFRTEIERFEHICFQSKFLKFSPEELRWKHQLESRNTGFGVS
ncbi:hypothetical protein EKO27_g11438 [Xylaria grammica]|uniref:Uncharacterized protein n=1 Tax=Xylaria grammica TaxID=363999 RepID=A0A439CNF3_9PEZI|nr:hypothetical protein EKO27_g11438 [Xylaria grammica]